MFFNNATCDVYIGKGAGKKLMHEIENARRSVKIVSPFLSPFLVEKLIHLYHKGIDVQLITTDTIEDFYGNRKRNIHELIRQEVHIDDEARRRRNRWKIAEKVLRWTSIIAFIIFLGLNYRLKDIRLVPWIIPIGLAYLLSRYFGRKSDSTQVYSYSYSQLFPFKVVHSKYENRLNVTYLHSKIYIIDDEIAYLGSLNFTGSGTKSNYETRVRLTDANSVRNIVEEFDHLMYEADLPEVDVKEWGKFIYGEPVN